MEPSGSLGLVIRPSWQIVKPSPSSELPGEEIDEQSSEEAMKEVTEEVDEEFPEELGEESLESGITELGEESDLSLISG
jgi:hypothetical protein